MKKTTKKTPEIIKGYKVFNPDFTCRDFQFEENKEFIHEGELSICNSGFQFCKQANDCFSYYGFNPENVVCEVEALGKILEHEDDSKVCTDIIKIGKRLTWEEVLVVSNLGKYNTGHSNSGDRNSGNSNSGNSNSGNRNSGDRNSGNRNSGDRNSGNRNSGNRNSGDWNSGDRNSGNRNSGDWNSGDWNSGDWNSGNSNSGNSNSGNWNSGAFCTDENPVVWLFDKPTKIKIKDWEDSEAVVIMRDYLETTMWIYSEDMTDEQKINNPSHVTTGGFLKTKSMHEAWADMWGNLGEEEKAVFIGLPNFNSKKWTKITGIVIE